MRRALLPLAALSIAIQPAALAAQDTTDPDILESERRIKRAEAEAAEHEADKLKYEKQKAAAEAKVGFLPDSPAEGKFTIGEGGGKLETEFLVADAVASAADYIAEAVDGRSDILLVEGPATRGNVRLLAFQAEAHGIKKAAARALEMPGDPCAVQPAWNTDRAVGIAAVGAGPLFGAGALIGALGDMLKTDTTVTGKESALTEEQLVRALLVKRTDLFRTTYFDAATFDPNNDVIKELDCLGTYDQAIQAGLAQFDTDEEKKANAGKIARLTAASAKLDELYDRLLEVEKDSPPLLGLLYADAEISKNSGSVLRVWIDASGGTFINRRNLWTMLGARSLGMTGGAVVSYLLIDRPTGKVAAAGFLKCTTDLVSLRRAHQPQLKTGYCHPLVEQPTIQAARPAEQRTRSD